MESQNQATEVKITSKSSYKNLDELIADMKLAFANALLPEIFNPMLAVGYTVERINGMKAKLDTLEMLAQVKTKEYADQSEEQDKFDKKKAEISTVFVSHISLARILFIDDVHARVSLSLDGSTPRLFSSWKQTMTNFYGQLTSQPELLAKASTVGITTTAVNDQKNAINELEAIKESLKKETGEAQAATDDRDRAFDEVYPLYVEYIKYAKIVLPDNQMLEALGVRVRAK